MAATTARGAHNNHQGFVVDAQPAAPHSARTSSNGPISPHRRYTWSRGSVSDVKAVRAGLGGTLNDVVLATITQGFRELLESRGERIEGRTVRILVPVSVRKADQKGSYDNRGSAMFAELPVGIAHPVERLRSISVSTPGQN